MTKEKYMALADFQTLWTNSIKPYIVGGFIAMLASTDANAKNLVLADGTNIPQSTFQVAGNYIAASEKGANNGVATLDANGKVPSSQLPSYVDDVIEAANFAALPATGEGGKIYVTLDNNKTYRWGGSAYVRIAEGLALGETEGTAYEGSKGKALKDAFDGHEADTDIHVTTSEKTTWNGKYAKPNGGIPKTDLAEAVQTSLGKADTALQEHQDISGKQNKITASGILKGDGTGGVTAAVAGTDYQAPLTAGTDYVAPVSGKGLSTEDYTSAEKTKLSGIAAGAQVNVIETVKVNGTALTPDANKAVNVEFEIPERVTSADLAGFVV